MELKVSITPEQKHSLKKSRQKKYGPKKIVNGTIHAEMVNTRIIMAAYITQKAYNFKLWDRGQMFVILSRENI